MARTKEISLYLYYFSIFILLKMSCWCSSAGKVSKRCCKEFGLYQLTVRQVMSRWSTFNCYPRQERLTHKDHLATSTENHWLTSRKLETNLFERVLNSLSYLFSFIKKSMYRFTFSAIFIQKWRKIPKGSQTSKQHCKVVFKYVKT